MMADALPRENLPWIVDEYLLVGDLWKRRGRSSGTSDPEVQALARLLGRSPASISRRIGNFEGTEHPGRGLKPITGEAFATWTRVKDDAQALANAVARATSRLQLLTNMDMTVTTSSDPRLVAPENSSLEPMEVTTQAESRQALRVEAQLVHEFRVWLDPRGTRLQGLLIPAGNQLLRADLYDTVNDVLIEAKARATRNHLRLAVGQLYDYRRYLTGFGSSLAVLVPERPSDDLMGLLDHAGAAAIWRSGNVFVDSAGGNLMRPRI
jgi:hypothetical protein